ncbi:MAG: hypothetical protein ACRCT8_11270 [Lacipirellulaceae bacterium]
MVEIETGREYAVLTGDVVGSSELAADDRKKLPSLLREVERGLGRLLGDGLAAPMAVFGGDSWQVLLARPSDALRAALFVRASLQGSELGIDTRVAVAVGTIDFVPDGRIEEADGEAFRLSGRLLKEGLGKRRRLGFTAADPARAERWDLVFALVDGLVRAAWTPKRARAITGALLGETEAQIADAEEPPTTRQAVHKRLELADWGLLEAAVEGYSAD